MPKPRNVSSQTRAALQVLLQQPLEWHHGYDLMTRTGLASGTLYPMLMRLYDQGYLEAEWVTSPHDGRPARHAYRLTSSGMTLARSTQQAATGAMANKLGVAT